MKIIENLNNTWFKQENNDVLNLSGTTNIYGKLNIVNNNFNYIESALFNNYTGNTLQNFNKYNNNTLQIFTNYTGNTQNVLNNAILLNNVNNSYNIFNKLGINNNNPEAYLDIITTGKTNGFRLVDGNQSNNKVLTTDNKGFGTWKPIVKSIRTDLSSKGTLLNHDLGIIPSIVTFYGDDKSINLDWSYNHSGLNQYNQIFIYSNVDIKDVVVNII